MSTTRFLGAALAAAASLLAAGCEDLEQEVRDTYQAYMAAVARKDAETALALTDPRYIEHMDFLAKKARTADRDAVMRLTTAERISILQMRNRLSKQELQALDGRTWLMRSFKEDADGESIFDVLQLGEITIRRPRASGTLEFQGIPTIIKMEFVKTGDRWVLDPMALEELVNDLAHKKYSSPQAEDQAIRGREGLRTGNTIRATIWDAPK